MTRPLSSLGAPAEICRAPEIPSPRSEVSVQDAELFWTDGTDARDASCSAHGEAGLLSASIKKWTDQNEQWESLEWTTSISAPPAQRSLAFASA
jgi:hypothetical protein